MHLFCPHCARDPPQSTTLRLVCLLDRTKNLHQSERLFYQRFHARPASVFVQTATKFKSKIQIEAKGKKVDAKSILMLMSMGLVKGTELTIVAEGEDEAAAVKELADLVNSKFGEE